jgi:hypothetical protein
MPSANRTELRRLTDSDAPRATQSLRARRTTLAASAEQKTAQRLYASRRDSLRPLMARLSASSLSRTTGRRVQRSRGWPSVLGIADAALAAL